MQLDTQKISAILPHRFPFLLIDKVTELQPDKKLTAIKNVSINEQFFTGHFPEEKIMPGVLIVEAMAQAGCVLCSYSKGRSGDNLLYYLGKVQAKFSKPVVPGDQLRIEVSPIKILPKAGFIRAKAFVDQTCVAEADIGFGIKDRA